jgi:hypothetical protein
MTKIESTTQAADQQVIARLTSERDEARGGCWIRRCVPFEVSIRPCARRAAAPEVLAVEFQQIERIEDRIALCRRWSASNTATPSSPRPIR